MAQADKAAMAKSPEFIAQMEAAKRQAGVVYQEALAVGPSMSRPLTRIDEDPDEHARTQGGFADQNNKDNTMGAAASQADEPMTKKNSNKIKAYYAASPKLEPGAPPGLGSLEKPREAPFSPGLLPRSPKSAPPGLSSSGSAPMQPPAGKPQAPVSPGLLPSSPPSSPKSPARTMRADSGPPGFHHSPIMMPSPHSPHSAMMPSPWDAWGYQLPEPFGNLVAEEMYKAYHNMMYQHSGVSDMSDMYSDDWWSDWRSAGRVPSDGWSANQETGGPLTTIMLRNIPQKIDREGLVEDLSERGFGDAYDFLYVPVDFETSVAMGYAFINFKSSKSLENFRQVYEGLKMKEHSPKICTITEAKVQGKARNLDYYRRSTVMRMPEEFHPILVEDGVRTPILQTGRPVQRPVPAKRRTSSLHSNTHSFGATQSFGAT